MWLSTQIRLDVEMGKLNVKVREDLDNKFRKEVFNRKGMKKGNLTKAIEEAMLLWINVPKDASAKESGRNIQKP